MGLFSRTPKKTTEQQIAETYVAAEQRRQAEAADARRTAAQQAESDRRRADWGARALASRAKCTLPDHSLCNGH